MSHFRSYTTIPIVETSILEDVYVVRMKERRQDLKESQLWWAEKITAGTFRHDEMRRAEWSERPGERVACGSAGALLKVQLATAPSNSR